MSTANKAAVRRFMSEFWRMGSLRAATRLGPSYVNRALGADLEAFKGFLRQITALPVRRFNIENLWRGGRGGGSHYDGDWLRPRRRRSQRAA